MTGVLSDLRRRLLAARFAYRAFLLPSPGAPKCVFGVCDGSGVLHIVDLDRLYEQDCVCLPLVQIATTRRRQPRTRLDAYRRQQAKTNTTRKA